MSLIVGKTPAALAALGAALLAGFASTRSADVVSAETLAPATVAVSVEDAAAMFDDRDGCEGCSHGYWKNHPNAWGPTGFATTDIWDSVFSVQVFGPTFTLLDALKQGGGGVNALGRESTAALLNGQHDGVEYCFPSTSRLFDDVKKAISIGAPSPLARRLDMLNNKGCPLN